MSIAGIVLAAGGSQRLGYPKQLIVYEGETLLDRAIRMADEAGAAPVVVVLGAYFYEIVASIDASKVITIHNDQWHSGMGSSVKAGMRALDDCGRDASGVLLMACDQPRLTADHLKALMRAFAAHGSAAIVASAYSGVHGVPAVFPRELFQKLSAIGGDKGARSIIEGATCGVVGIDFPGGDVDIDAPADVLRLHE